MISDIRGETLLKIYSDENVTRYEYSRTFGGIQVAGFVDLLHKHSIFHFHLSVLTGGKSISFALGKSCEIRENEHLVFLEDRQVLVWLPPRLKAAAYENGRLKRILEHAYAIGNGHNGCELLIEPPAANRLMVSFCMFTEHADDYCSQIVKASEVEKRATTRARWFYYSGCHDFWRYLVNGRFYNLRPDFPFESQLLANVFYFYFQYLKSQTGKNLYASLRDYTAYLTLLSLPADGRWRHGIWQRDDSHYCHWIAGANVLMHFYKVSNRNIFLEKSKQVLDFSIQYADRCVEGMQWYLHDSLEMPDNGGTAPYTKTRRSTLMGKSETNTLALNTHIGTLLSLKHLHGLTKDNKYQTAYLEGLCILEQLLQCKPAGMLYSIVYGVRDILTKLCVDGDRVRFRKVIWHYDKLMSNTILPRLKHRWPRLFMPNGFIERDLTFSCYNQFYHLLNLEQLLMLYKVEPSEWLNRLLVKAVQFTVKSKMALYLAISDELALTFLGVLLQYGTSIDAGYLKILERYTVAFVNRGYSLPTKILASPLISDVSSAVRTPNEKILLLIGDKPALNVIGIILNLSSENQEFTLESDEMDLYYLEDWKGKRSSAGNTVNLAGLTSLKICLEK